MLVTGCGRLLMLVRRMGVNVGRTGVQQEAIEVANRRRGNCLEERQDDQQRDCLANHRFILPSAYSLTKTLWGAGMHQRPRRSRTG